MGNNFPKINKKLGFGMMRLPMNGEDVDIELTKEMVDFYMENGFNYFDTAHGYINGKSELAVKEALTDRYERERYILVNKLTGSYFEKEEDIIPFFNNQLKLCGVDYFDIYLMHAQGSSNYEKFKKCKAYETAFRLKKEGKVKHVGLSFHDKADFLDKILTEYPEIEVVQIQYNYMDMDNPIIESRKVYDVVCKHNKPIIVMEPVKGGNLVKLPPKAQEVLDEINRSDNSHMSNASYAIRYAAGAENVAVVLSGMSNMEQMRDNVSYMKDFKPLSHKENAAVEKIVEVFNRLEMIDCTSCHYCTEENKCPVNIQIPEILACLNSKKIFNDFISGYYYKNSLTAGAHSKASACVGCGGCEKVCPQKLPIIKLLKDAAEEFETSEGN